MKAGAGKSKGNAFEWATSRRLSLWLTGGEDKTQLIPTRSSGGWAGNEGEGAWRQIGDLAPNGPVGDHFRRRFALEAKHHKLIDWWHYWTSAPGDNLVGWWLKLQAEIAGYDDVLDGRPPVPFIVFRQNHRPIMGALPVQILRPAPGLHTLTSPHYGFAVAPLDDILSAPAEAYYERVEAGWPRP